MVSGLPVRRPGTMLVPGGIAAAGTLASLLDALTRPAAEPTPPPPPPPAHEIPLDEEP